MPPDANATNLFKEHCEDIARNFVQTMVFMDDDAGYYRPATIQQKSQSPAKGLVGRSVSKTTSNKHTHEEKQRSEDKQSHALYVDDILESAMRNGLICSIFKPQTDNDFKIENLKAVLSADIVCFDWIMRPDKPEDEGQATSELIRDLIQEDKNVGGRHRLIAIYTFKPNFEDILNAVKSQLSKCAPECELDANFTSLTGKHFRVVCLHKEGSTLPKERQVSAKDLPDRLIKEFSLFNQGLIPNLTMASIAVLRESTAHILAKLNSDLDGPFLTHKSLLPNPNDATDYASEIISSELKAAIHKHRISNKLLANEVIKSFIEGRAPVKFKYLNENKAPIETDVDANLFYKLITEGMPNLISSEVKAVGLEFEKKVDDVGEIEEREITENEERSLIANSISSFLTQDQKTALNNNWEFLKVTNIAADQASQIYLAEDKGGHGKLPLLQLGTVVKHGGNFMLCLQPSCDSVRVKPKGEQFLFLSLSKVSAEPTLVVTDGGKLTGLTYKPNIKNSRLITFKPISTEVGPVVSSRAGKNLFFVINSQEDSVAAKKYQWIAELKVDIARKIGQELANQYSRIGLDEFELSRMEWKYK